MKKSKNLKDSSQTQRSDSKKNWKIQDILGIVAGVIIAISIPVLMAIVIVNYACLYKDIDSPNVREQINEEIINKGGYRYGNTSTD